MVIYINFTYGSPSMCILRELFELPPNWFRFQEPCVDVFTLSLVTSSRGFN